MGMSEVWLIPALPAAAFVILLLFGKYLPRGGDWLAIVMLAVFSFVSLMVQVYSVGYMRGDPKYGWYFTVMSLFAASMLTLVLADNLLLLYAAWEGVGFCSFLLIGFWWEQRSAAEAAKKAFITTRIGDVGFLIGIILLYKEAGTFDISEIFKFARAGGYSDTYLTTAVLFLFAGAVGKSAQFPLHVWLPDAMEGPTPVSALIHAATMVVAGVYMVARMFPLFDLADPPALDVVLALGLITVIISACMGLAATDIKRVIAYSTLNSLGLMFVALGAGSVTAAMFYLLVHGFFKALLFLGSGSVIHATEQQDVRELGGLSAKMPVTSTVFAIGALAMIGIIPLSGFWAKDEILHSVKDGESWLIFLAVLASLFVTGLYMTRLYILTFLFQPKNREAQHHAHDAPPVMTVPLLLLAALTLVAGFVVFDFVGEALGFPGGIGKFVYANEAEGFDFNVWIAIASTFLAGGGIAAGWFFWSGTAERAERAAERLRPLHLLFLNRFYFDDAYQWVINSIVLTLGKLTAWFDRTIVNDMGVDGSAHLGYFTGFEMKFLESGKLPNYALAISAGVVVIAIAFLVFVV